MHIIVKGNTHPLNENYYCHKTRESVTLKSKMEKVKWLLLLLHVLHGDDSHHFLLDVGDLWVDLTNHVIHSGLAEEMRVFNENNINNAAGWNCFKEDQSRAASSPVTASEPGTNLIVFVNKRQSEEPSPGQDDQGHHIEP